MFVGKNFGDGGVTSTSVGAIGPQTLTLSDMVYRVFARSEALETDTRREKMIVRNVRSAIADLPHKHEWKFLQSTHRIFAPTPQDYTNASYVAATQIVSISSGSWPENATDGELLLNSSRYPVIQRISDSQLRISGPASNITANAQWSQSAFLLPRSSRIMIVMDEESRTYIPYLTPASFVSHIIHYPEPGNSDFYSTFAGRDGRTLIRFTPPPVADSAYYVLSKDTPIHPSIFRSQTTASGISNEDTITAGSAKPNWVGAVLRYGESHEAIIEGDYSWQGLITGVASNILTMDRQLDETIDNQACVISSPLDIAETLQTHIEDAAYAYYCKVHKHEDRRDAMAIAASSLRDAIIADNSTSDRLMHAGSDWHGPSLPVFDTMHFE